jgi:serine/threonine-protein kinase HipA
MAKLSANTICVNVFADWYGLNGPTLIGELLATLGHNGVDFTFRYTDEWIKYTQINQINLDPQLRFDNSPQFHDPKQNNFSFLLDSSPDRWGRQLIAKKEALNPSGKPLNELDFLLLVNDYTRCGALRFKIDDGPFLDDSPNPVPPIASLRELQFASRELEKYGSEDNPEYGKLIQRLVDPGSSLGGARPKANVIDEKNNLWIAKFPSANDMVDKGAWEMVMHELATLCGIATPTAQIIKFSGEYHTYLSKRFDRIKNRRVHFASAMTLLARTDGENHNDGASYLDFIDIISTISCNPVEDLNQLWHRIVFFICVSNTDDHLRNHGFILTPHGWRLSPMYDVNPNASGRGLTLNIDEKSNVLSLELAMEVAPFFHIPTKDVLTIVNKIVNGVRQWRKLASKYNITRLEQEKMAPAFQAAEM